MNKVKSSHKTKTTLMSEKTKNKDSFKVFHYAGEVTYSTLGFVVRNADKVMETVRRLASVVVMEL